MLSLIISIDITDLCNIALIYLLIYYYLVFLKALCFLEINQEFF